MKKLVILFLLSFIFGGNLRAQLIINEVLYDPSNIGLAGDANGNGVYGQTEDEFIELLNYGTSSLNVSGFQIWDDTLIGTMVYKIPMGIIIPANGALVIFGGGTPVGGFGGAIVLADTGVSGLSFGNTLEKIAIRDSLGKTILFFDSDALSNNPDESYTRSPDFTGAFVQHASLNPRKFSPGTKLDGSPFSIGLAKQVTFKVDLNKYPGNFDSVFVSGIFNQYCNNCNPMYDNNRDGLWEITIPLSVDSIEYLFKLKSGSNYIQENFVLANACTKSNGTINTRYGIIKKDSTLNTVCFESCTSCSGNLSLKGVTDFKTPLLGNSGKSIHLVNDSIIPNLSIYGLGVANNGGGSDGQEYRFPRISVPAGNHILVVRDSAGMAAYLSSCWTSFNLVLIDSIGIINQNGNDAVELFKVGDIVETFGDANQDGLGKPWEYTGSWAYKNNSGVWTYGGINCTDSSTTTYNSKCIYPICAAIKISSIIVEGEGNVSTITQNAGTLKMIETVLPANAGNKSISWSVDNTSLATINTFGILTAKANGEVNVKATALDGSGIFGTKKITITGQANSIAELNKVSVKIYPNPIENILYIESVETINEFKIYSIDGKLILNEKVSKNQINLSELSTGAYFIEFKIDEYLSSYKFIKN